MRKLDITKTRGIGLTREDCMRIAYPDSGARGKIPQAANPEWVDLFEKKSTKTKSISPSIQRSGISELSSLYDNTQSSTGDRGITVFYPTSDVGRKVCQERGRGKDFNIYETLLKKVPKLKKFLDFYKTIELKNYDRQFLENLYITLKHTKHDSDFADTFCEALYALQPEQGNRAHIQNFLQRVHNIVLTKDEETAKNFLESYTSQMEKHDPSDRWSVYLKITKAAEREARTGVHQ